MNTYPMLGAGAALLSAFVWAYASSHYSHASKDHPAFVINGTRTFIGILIFLAILLANPEKLTDGYTLSTAQGGWLLLAAFGSFGFGDALFLRATHRLGVSTTLTIGSSYPVLSALAGSLWGRDSLGRLTWLGIGAVVIGVILVLHTQDDFHPQSSGGASRKEFRLGLLYAFGTACCWAFLSIALSRASVGADTVVFTFSRMFVAFVVCIVVGFLMERSIQYPLLSGAEMRHLLPICAFEMGVGGFAFTYAYQHASLPVAATLTSIYPVFALLLSVYAGQERFSPLKLVGMGCVLAGISLIVLCSLPA